MWAGTQSQYNQQRKRMSHYGLKALSIVIQFTDFHIEDGERKQV